ncbi:hypothetical protein F7Q99_25390 [Streptomyces kaniharaensis]|uniref:Uncharacterized protein n=1 Tax=Streptomyces kaniharaensis TaxID=212423 RepID=A0A6N7L138_9ACTN|nr:hypothetical protein [Streptomyces kaniharaensis]MQS15513.1 hypothetical protein [Streptomyces kaniharaensis]
MRTTTRSTSRRRAVLAAAATAALALSLAACGSSGHSGMPGMDHGAMTTSAAATAGTTPSGPASASGMDGMPGMPGMDKAAAGDGLAPEKDGYRLDPKTDNPTAGQAAGYAFVITGPDGKPVTDFAVDQTKKLHFYAVRTDLTGYQHLHPAMAADGTWTADLAALTPGTWRLYTSFTPNAGSGKGTDFVLSRTVTVPGDATTTPLPPASTTATVDGYTVTVQGEPMAGMAHPLTVTFAKDGQPVTDLQPYLDTYAHVSAFHEGDQAFAHFHPQATAGGDHGGPNLTFHAELPKPGNWRVFLQFQTAGQLHTAALTLHVN